MLLPMLDTAVQNSNKGLKRIEKDHVQLLSRESNPATNVQELVSYLKKVTE